MNITRFNASHPTLLSLSPSDLKASKELYFACITAYRQGNLEPFEAIFTEYSKEDSYTSSSFRGDNTISVDDYADSEEKAALYTTSKNRIMHPSSECGSTNFYLDTKLKLHNVMLRKMISKARDTYSCRGIISKNQIGAWKKYYPEPYDIQDLEDIFIESLFEIMSEKPSYKKSYDEDNHVIEIPIETDINVVDGYTLCSKLKWVVEVKMNSLHAISHNSFLEVNESIPIPDTNEVKSLYDQSALKHWSDIKRRYYNYSGIIFDCIGVIRKHNIKRLFRYDAKMVQALIDILMYDNRALEQNENINSGLIGLNKAPDRILSQLVAEYMRLRKAPSDKQINAAIKRIQNKLLKSVYGDLDYHMVNNKKNRSLCRKGYSISASSYRICKTSSPYPLKNVRLFSRKTEEICRLPKQLFQCHSFLPLERIRGYLKDDVLSICHEYITDPAVKQKAKQLISDPLDKIDWTSKQHFNTLKQIALAIYLYKLENIYPKIYGVYYFYLCNGYQEPMRHFTSKSYTVHWNLKGKYQGDNLTSYTLSFFLKHTGLCREYIQKRKYSLPVLDKEATPKLYHSIDNLIVVDKINRQLFVLPLEGRSR